MAFINHRLSSRVERGFEGGPEMDVTIVPNAGGHEARIANWDQFHWKFNADYAGFEAGEKNDIYNAFLAAYANRDSFRFKDWNDFTATDQALGTGDGTNTPRQLRKYYTFGPVSRARDIILPIASTVVVTDNGAPFAVMVNDQTGMVTPASGNWISGHIYVASFHFDVRVRFGQSYYPFKMSDRKVVGVSIDLVQAITP